MWPLGALGMLAKSCCWSQASCRKLGQLKGLYIASEKWWLKGNCMPARKPRGSLSVSEGKNRLLWACGSWARPLVGPDVLEEPQARALHGRLQWSPVDLRRVLSGESHSWVCTLGTSAVPAGHMLCARSLGRVRLCSRMDRSPPGPSVRRISSARVLGWRLLPSPGGLPDPGILPAPALTGRCFTAEPPGSQILDRC